ncbi:MAG TPA: CBS domain-containing protein [Pyrinomonadaceae bacterium]|nr:CBS domain-containing protein [Pyrinomonadaceae bacterium]
MLVESLMTPDPESCRPEASLADAASIMWRRDCGVVPVTEGDGVVVGIITDRDICMALALGGRLAAEVSVGEAMSRDVQTCTPVDDVREALELMRARQLRRLPVVNSLGKLAGILSMNDVVLRTRKGKGKKQVARGETIKAIKAISRPHGAVEDEAHSDENILTPELVETSEGEGES